MDKGHNKEPTCLVWLSVGLCWTLLSSDLSSCVCLQPSSSLQIRPNTHFPFNKEQQSFREERHVCFSLVWFSDVPLFLSEDESGEVGVQLALLGDPPLLHAVPTFLLRYPQSAGNVVAKVQPLLLCQVISWKKKKKSMQMNCKLT